ncbi:MAG: hypothetical protein OEM26_06870 [Saprospiraceae bacterium]|nr:hypothetical protein [Saprospiraceae bacterium]
MKHFTLALFLTFLCIPLSASYFEFSEKARDAYQFIFSLQFDEAQDKIIELKIAEPDNQIRHLLANYIDCLTIFVTEDESAFDELKQNKQLRLDAIKDGDPQSPYYLFAQAEIHLHWAICRAKFEEYFQAVIEVRRAYNLLEKNAQLFPDFIPNKKNLGLMHAMIGTVPDKYRWGVKLLGMNGTIEQGRGEIEEVLAYAEAEEDFIYATETRILYAYLLFHLSNQEDLAWQQLEKAKLDPAANPIACFVMANLAMRTGRNDLALELLSKRPKGSRYFPFPYLDFMMGVAKLNRLDPDADQAFLAFLRQTRGRNYIKESYQKLAWHAVLHDHPDDYWQYMETCKRLGVAIIDEDLAALREARQRKLPNKQLLKARVLFDGAYYEQARSTLSTKQSDPTDSLAYELEYNYRLGRIYDMLDQDEIALQYYQKTIDQGRYEGFYFACNAALMSGRIFEEQERWDEAKSFYELTLSIKSDEYRSSLHQKAKAGLNRIEESN